MVLTCVFVVLLFLCIYGAMSHPLKQSVRCSAGMTQSTQCRTFAILHLPYCQAMTKLPASQQRKCCAISLRSLSRESHPRKTPQTFPLLANHVWASGSSSNALGAAVSAANTDGLPKNDHGVLVVFRDPKGIAVLEFPEKIF